MKKVLFGILAIFMSLSLAYGSGSLIQNFVLHSQSQTGNEEEEEIKITASGNWKDNAAGSFNGGNGSPDNPYKIATAGQLALLSNEVNGGESYSGKYFQLTADINLSAHYWTSIGHQNYIYRAFAKDELLVRPFKGTFDGQGFTVSGITISVTRKTLTNEDEYYNCVNNGSGELYCPRYFGLFGYVSGATIKNFSVDGKFNFEGGINATYEVWAETYVGGAVGYAADTTISNVDNVGLKILNVRKDWQDCIFSKKQYIGGVVGGISGGSIEYCDYSSSIKYTVESRVNQNHTAEFNLGGIVGAATNKAAVLNCYSSGSISFEGSTGEQHTTRMGTLKIGGVIAHSRDSTIKNCLANGLQLSISNGFYLESGYDLGAIGGIVGHGSGDTIDSCFNYKEISASEVRRFAVGGVVGRTSYGSVKGSVNGCGNFGSLNLTAVQGEGLTGYGGIVGHAASYNISNCANYGNITTKGGGYNISYIGGIAGDIGGTIEKCVNYGTMSGYRSVGGIVGGASSLTLKKSINFSEKVAAPGGYGGLVVGSVSGGSIESCYFNNAGGYDGGPGGGKSAKSSEELHKFDFLKRDDILGDSLKEEYDNRSNGWILSTLPVQYFSGNDRDKKGMLEYALVPMGAMAEVNVSAKWKAKDEKDSEFANLADFGNIEVWTYSKKEKGACWKESTEFQYLIGVVYTDTNNAFFRFKVSENFQLQGRVGTSSLYLVEIKYSDGIEESIFCVENNEYYYILFRHETFVKYDAEKLPLIQSSQLKLMVSSTQKPLGKFSIVKVTSETKAEDSNGTSGIIEVTSKDGYQYQDIVKVNATPKVGWAYLGIFEGAEQLDKSIFSVDTLVENAGGENEDKILNTTSSLDSGNLQKSQISKYGEVNLKFHYNFEGQYNVCFSAIDYQVCILNQWQLEDNKVPEQEKRTFVELNHGDKNEGVLQLQYGTDLEYGYKYNFYVCENEEVTKIPENLSNAEGFKKIGVYENFQGKAINLAYADIIGNVMTNININKFFIFVTRDLIDYEVTLENRANYYNKGYSGDIVGGSAIFTNGNEDERSNYHLNVEGTYVLECDSKTFYEFSGISYSGQEELPASAIFTGELIQFSSIINQIMGSGNKPTDNKIVLYAYFSLKSYTLNWDVMIDNSTPSGEDKLVIDVKTEDIKHSSANPNSFRYKAPVTLTAPEGQIGYRFVGWFIKGNYTSTDASEKINKCLSVNKTFTFYHNTSELEEVNITAFYETYATTDKVLIDKRKVYTISSKEDLVWLSNKVEGGETFAGCIFNQTANIDMAKVLLNPIGNVDTPFKGTYNGNNYEILNLKLVGNRGGFNYNSHLSYMGLFGVTDGATLKNLTFRDGSISGYSHVGALVGYAKNTIIENVQNHSLTIIPSAVTFHDIYKNSISLKSLEDGKDYCGNYYATRQYFGGVVGLAENTKMIGLSNKAAVGEESVESVGGVVGCLKGESILQQSFNEGTVSGKTTDLLANNLVLVKDNVKDCFARNQGTTILYNATGKNGSSVSGEYSQTEEGKISFSQLDNSIWILVNGKLCLKYFYWN